MSGLTKTIIALLPALAAFLTLFLMKEKDQLWGILFYGLIILGGIIAATFVAKGMARSNPERSVVFLGFMWILVLVGYAVSFFFTGCLLAITTGSLA